MDKAVQILCGEMCRQCREYLRLQAYPNFQDKAAALKEEIIRLYIEISSLMQVRR